MRNLISQLTLFKKQYDEEYKKELTRGVKTFKLFKLFYLMYYYVRAEVLLKKKFY